MEELSRKSLEKFIAPLRVAPDTKVSLPDDFDPASTAGIDEKEEGVELLARSVELLADYQARLAAQDTWGVLVILQALDAAGKDGTIRHVMSGVNPQGVSVHSFKVPSEEELDHDYLWRYAQHLPARGEIGIFNRSHYEEVLVVRVHPELLDRQKLPPEARTGDVWKRRFREINDWERHLADNGFRIVKLFLNISKEEQRERLLRRIDLPDHNWKFSPADVRERRARRGRRPARPPRGEDRTRLRRGDGDDRQRRDQAARPPPAPRAAARPRARPAPRHAALALVSVRAHRGGRRVRHGCRPRGAAARDPAAPPRADRGLLARPHRRALPG
jgi:PPK2 family polyphosphate:nucleotide phosphotransferase